MESVKVCNLNVVKMWLCGVIGWIEFLSWVYSVNLDDRVGLSLLVCYYFKYGDWVVSKVY